MPSGSAHRPAWPHRPEIPARRENARPDGGGAGRRARPRRGVPAPMPAPSSAVGDDPGAAAQLDHRPGRPWAPGRAMASPSWRLLGAMAPTCMGVRSQRFRKRRDSRDIIARAVPLWIAQPTSASNRHPANSVHDLVERSEIAPRMRPASARAAEFRRQARPCSRGQGGRRRCAPGSARRCAAGAKGHLQPSMRKPTRSSRMGGRGRGRRPGAAPGWRPHRRVGRAPRRAAARRRHSRCGS